MLFGKRYNPRDISQYFGKTFTTESGSKYSITNDGKVRGRESIENYSIELIAGLEDSEFLRSKYDSHSKEILDSIIRKSGKKIKKGLHLVISLKDDAALQTSRVGLSTGKIIAIEDTL